MPTSKRPKATGTEPVPEALAADIAAAAAVLDDTPPPVAPSPSSTTKRPARDTAPKPQGRPSKAAKRREALIGTLALVGTGLSLVDRYDGAVVLASAEHLADALTAAAENVPALAKAIDALNSTSAWGAVAAAVLPVVVCIAANHNAAPPSAATAIAGTIHETAMSIAGDVTWPKPRAAKAKPKPAPAAAPATDAADGVSWSTAAA